MKKFAVGVISFFDSVLNIEIIEASSWLEALGKHKDIEYEFLPSECKSMEDLKGDFFSVDMTFDIKEIE